MNPAIASDIKAVREMTEISGGITPGSKRVALAVYASLLAESGIFVELLGAVIGVKQKNEIVMAQIAASGVHGLER